MYHASTHSNIKQVPATKQIPIRTSQPQRNSVTGNNDISIFFYPPIRQRSYRKQELQALYHRNSHDNTQTVCLLLTRKAFHCFFIHPSIMGILDIPPPSTNEDSLRHKYPPRRQPYRNPRPLPNPPCGPVPFFSA